MLTPSPASPIAKVRTSSSYTNTLNPKSQTQNPKPYTQTLNPEPNPTHLNPKYKRLDLECHEHVKNLKLQKQVLTKIEKELSVEKTKYHRLREQLRFLNDRAGYSSSDSTVQLDEEEYQDT